MKSLTVHMTRINSILQTGYIGETTSLGLAGSAAGLGFFEIITPIAAFLAALVAIASGLYTLRLTRLKYKGELERQNEAND